MSARRAFFAGAAVMLAAAVAFMPTFADATHINEPVRPIVALSDPVIFNYVDGRPTKIPCDGTAVYPHNAARLEADATPAVWPDKYAPSEHWKMRVNVFVQHKPGSTGVYDETWVHSNIPPHNAAATWKVLQTNLWNIQGTPGEWVVILTMTTDVSKQVFVRQCKFQVVGA